MDSVFKCFDCACWRCFNVFCSSNRCSRLGDPGLKGNCIVNDCSRAVFIWSKEDAIKIVEEYAGRFECY